VSLLYGKLFYAEVVVDTTKPLGEVQEEHLRRFANKIPPGYKDQAKDDQGIGDFLIWLTILEIGSTRRTSVIFVSGEEKADWWHRSEQQPLYPCFELVDEFRRVSGGCSFHIIKFSQLLGLFGASTEVVAEVQEEERVVASQVPSPPEDSATQFVFEVTGPSAEVDRLTAALSGLGIRHGLGVGDVAEGTTEPTHWKLIVSASGYGLHGSSGLIEQITQAIRAHGLTITRPIGLTQGRRGPGIQGI
jgi:PIN domain-containing protein